MTTTNDGGQAFPTDGAYAGYKAGMSLRDWFAGQAVAWMLAAMSDPNVETMPAPEFAAEYVYRVADAMLAARK